jgi:hypothetical protein
VRLVQQDNQGATLNILCMLSRPLKSDFTESKRAKLCTLCAGSTSLESGLVIHHPSVPANSNGHGAEGNTSETLRPKLQVTTLLPHAQDACACFAVLAWGCSVHYKDNQDMKHERMPK